MSHPPAQLTVVLMGRGSQHSEIFPLNKGIITIGRDSSNDIVVDDAEVSRYHARLAWQGTACLLVAK